MRGSVRRRRVAGKLLVTGLLALAALCAGTVAAWGYYDVCDAGADHVTDEGCHTTFAGTIIALRNDDYQYYWDWGDGNTFTDTFFIVAGDTFDATRTHAYGDDGVFTAALWYTELGGSSVLGQDTAVATVCNVPPCAEAGPLHGVNEGEPVHCDGTFIDPGWHDTHISDWNFGDGTGWIPSASQDETNNPPMGQGVASVTHTYASEGTYIVTFRVCDDAGACGSDTSVVTCYAVAGDDSPELGTWVLLACTGALGAVVRRRKK